MRYGHMGGSNIVSRHGDPLLTAALTSIHEHHYNYARPPKEAPQCSWWAYRRTQQSPRAVRVAMSGWQTNSVNRPSRRLALLKIAVTASLGTSAHLVLHLVPFPRGGGGPTAVLFMKNSENYIGQVCGSSIPPTRAFACVYRCTHSPQGDFSSTPFFAGWMTTPVTSTSQMQENATQPLQACGGGGVRHVSKHRCSVGIYGDVAMHSLQFTHNASDVVDLQTPASRLQERVSNCTRQTTYVCHRHR